MWTGAPERTFQASGMETTGFESGGPAASGRGADPQGPAGSDAPPDAPRSDADQGALETEPKPAAREVRFALVHDGTDTFGVVLIRFSPRPGESRSHASL